MRTVWIVGAMLWLASAHAAWAAVGCTLSNPARDLLYLYPAMTTFRETSKDMLVMPDGRALYRRLQQRVGHDLDPVYETIDTPYTVYTVYQGESVIGIVHGVNVPGQGGVIQVFLSTDPQSGAIGKFFFQRLESPSARALKDKRFRARFEGLTLADFYKHDYFAAVDPANAADRVAGIATPEPGGVASPDFHATLRGVRKNLILLDMFVYQQKSEPYHERAIAAIRSARASVPAAAQGGEAP